MQPPIAPPPPDAIRPPPTPIIMPPAAPAIPMMPPPMVPAVPPPAMDQTRASQMFMSNMMTLMLRLTKPEKNIQSAEPDLSITPKRTLYVNNLNDKIKPPKMTRDLRERFGAYGEVTNLMALSSFWRRGQAYITFKNQADATRAMDCLQGQMYEGKPMRINYAREETHGDSEGGGMKNIQADGKRAPKKPRAILERETALQEQFRLLQQQMSQFQQQPPFGIPGIKADPLAPPGAPLGDPDAEEGRKRKAFSMSLKGAESEAKRIKAEENPPNKTLFMEKLPSDCDEGELIAIFSAFEGFEKVRLIAIRNVAFVDFKSIPDAAVALQAISNDSFRGGKPLVATFAKR